MTPSPPHYSLRSLLPMPNESRLARAWPRIVLVTLLAVLVTFVERGLHLQTYSLTATPFTLLGVAISFFLGFRNTTAYNRYWEARTLWGRLINTSRALARQTLTQAAPTRTTPSAPVDMFASDGDTDGENAEALRCRGDGPTVSEEAEAREVHAWQEGMVHLVIGYAHSLHHHLRGSKVLPTLHSHMNSAELERLRGQDNMPLGLLVVMAQRLQEARRRGWLNAPDILIMEGSLTQLTEVLGGCERIHNTPMPITYTLLSHRIVTIFCCALPFGLVDTVKVLTPFVVFLVSYAFIGLDVLGEEISDPFGTDPHDIPLPALTATIEANLMQMLNEHKFLLNEHKL